MLSVGSALLGAALQERIGKHQGKKYTKLWRTKDVLSPIPSTPSKKPLPVTTPHGRALFHSFKNTNGIFFPVQKRCQQKDVPLLPDGAGAVQGPTANTLSSTTHSCSALGASTEALTIGLNRVCPHAAHHAARHPSSKETTCLPGGCRAAVRLWECRVQQQLCAVHTQSRAVDRSLPAPLHSPMGSQFRPHACSSS